jgi:hypothetical protein
MLMDVHDAAAGMITVLAVIHRACADQKIIY